ncbi:MAG: PAS domain-containing protein, partial [Syntrophales bacterium]|nr:PAS domain-containing protein [Syntrophales bacterium]
MEKNAPQNVKTACLAMEGIEGFNTALGDMAPVGMYVAQGGRFLWMNRCFLEQIGYAPEEVVVRPCLSLVHEEDRERVRRSAIAILRGETVEPYQYRAVAKAGNILWCLEMVVSIACNGERAVLGYQMDVTSKTHMEDALRESEERYRTIIDTITDAYYEVDLAGNSIFFNDAYLDLYEYSREEMQGLNFRDYSDKGHAHAAFQIFHQVFETGRPAKNMEWEIIAKSGKRKAVELSVSLMRNA